MYGLLDSHHTVKGLEESRKSLGYRIIRTRFRSDLARRCYGTSHHERREVVGEVLETIVSLKRWSNRRDYTDEEEHHHKSAGEGLMNEKTVGAPPAN